MILLAIYWAIDVLLVTLLVILALGAPIQLAADAWLYGRFAVNFVTLGLLLSTLVVYRGEFSAVRSPGNFRKALITALVGLAVVFGIGFGLVTLVPGSLQGVGAPGRLSWIAQRLFGQDPSGPPAWIATTVGVLSAAVLCGSLLVLVRSQRQASYMSDADETDVRALVAQSPEDSLAYFATRRDKSAIFARSGKGAITYRTTLGVCLASSDPLGRPDHWKPAIDAWLELAHGRGWMPAVIGASEAGARAYAAQGLRVIRLGDEAVLHPAQFHLDGRDMRPVRQAVQRMEKAGYTTRIRRHRDIDPSEMTALVQRTDAWRDTDGERGFSMALGRLGNPGDGDCLMVEALFPDGRAVPGGPVAALLSFVPWGTDGFSLDLMRRHPLAENGINELMVAHLLGERTLGLRQVSLNFAVFRSVFEEGARIGAGPVLRLWRRLLLVMSRWWQIEALYRSNVKYLPTWQPRFLCFPESADIATVGIAAAVAEGFVDLPRFLTPEPQLLQTPQPTLAVAASTVRAEPAGPRVPEQMRQRLATRQRLVDSGTDPYPVVFVPTTGCAQVALGESVQVAGRVINVRDHGGVIFVRIRDWTGDAQLMLTDDRSGCAELERFRRDVDLGDHVGAAGTMVCSARGELSVGVENWLITAKALRPLPDKHAGIADAEARVRQRYLDLAVNPLTRHRLVARSAAIRAVRDTLHGQGFLEVETPILQTIHGGANARPFRTHINAYDLDLYLRIAPELFLKRLMVGGVDKIFEIGRNFRNEGSDSTHNPEFSMLEAYQAYGDYSTMRTVAQELIMNAARAANDSLLLVGADHSGATHEVDLGQDWPVITVNDAISAAAGESVSADTDHAALVALAGRLSINVDPAWTRGNVLLELYEHLVEHRTVRPTFYTAFPAEVSPLTRGHRDDPRLAERWDLVAFGAEIGTAYSELVDPVEQRRRLTEQSLQAAGGDAEAMELDEEFLVALEHAMPPTGGLGMGIDRLVMMLSGTSIRDTITFPLVRPRAAGRP